MNVSFLLKFDFFYNFIVVGFYKLLNNLFMNKLHQSITINASKQRVWNAIINLSQYKIWTEAFTPGSYFEGNWQ